MSKEKSKKPTKKKKKDAEQPVKTAAAVVATPTPEVVVKENPKTSLLPKTIAKPIEELSKRVKALEDLVAKLLGN